MEWGRPAGGREFHPVGFSNHKNEYRRGVCQGNYAEELLATDYCGRSGFVLGSGGTFSSDTTSKAAYSLTAGKAGAELAAAARRQDIFLKHCKYGGSHVLPEDRTAFYASTSQLAYGAGDAGAAGGGADAQRVAARPKVQDCLWGHSKFDNRKVPLSMQADAATSQRRQQLEAEAAASPYRTVEKEMIGAAARDPAARAAARPPMAHPRDLQGEDTSVGRKAAGEFCQLFDKDYMRIGLRKPQANSSP